MTHLATTRTTRLLAALAAAGLTTGLATAPANAGADPRPTTYVVSTTPGENLEGIEVTRDGTIYVTSVATGAVYRGDVRDSTLALWLPGGSDGRDHATGIHVDRWGRVLVAGAMTGTFFVYAADGTLLQRLTVPGDAFLNDFAFTREHVYVTDSAQGTVWRATIDAAGVGPLEPFVTADDFTPAATFLNGIASTPGGRSLIVSDWGTDVTHTVDLTTGGTTPVTVTGADGVFSADGLVLTGHTAVGVQTDWDTEQTVLRTVRFNADFTAATVLGDSAPRGFEDSPTTVARDRGRWLWVDSQLNVDPASPPFTVSVVPTR